MNVGWVKLHRTLLDNPRVSDPDWLAVWIHLLLRASHAPFKTVFDGRMVELKPGQLVTGRLAISQATGVSDSKVFRVLNVMKSEQQIEQQAGTKSSIFTVLNWDRYQTSEQQIAQQLNSKRTATEQQLNTLQEWKNTKNEKNGKTEDVGQFELLREGEARPAGAGPASKSTLSDSDWLAELQADPAYQQLDVRTEHARMAQWCAVNRKQPTRRRFINWLNRCDKPMSEERHRPNHEGGF